MKVLVDYRMKEVFLDYFRKNKIECIKISCESVYDEISGHPDIFFVNILGKIFKAQNVIIDKKIDCIEVESVEKGYPETAKYNIVVNDKYVIGNFKYIGQSVNDYIDTLNLKKINVNQGYTRCSLVSLDSEHYITSDIGIKINLEKEGLNVIYVENEDIKLMDRNGNYSKMQGFIGGAMAKIGDTVLLFGDKKKLKNGEKIEKYIKDLGLNFIDFEGEDVIDYGSVIVIE